MIEILVVMAAVLVGLSAGLFATFSYVVMPGLRGTDDATFVQSMRSINVAILNPVFAVVLGGSAVAAIAATVVAWGTDAAPWLLAAVVLHVAGAFVVTGAVNVPLNNALEAGSGGAPSPRAAFERRWTGWNHVRSVLTLAAFVCSVVAATKA